MILSSAFYRTNVSNLRTSMSSQLARESEMVKGKNYKEQWPA